MAKAKPATPEQWAKAKALFETGKSLNDISTETGIDRSTVSKRAKNEGWEKGKFQQLIADGARVAEVISTLDSTAQEVVTKAIDEQTKVREFYAKAGQKVAMMAVKSMGETPKPIDCKIVADTLVSTMRVSGVVPYYPAAATITNTNAQQNNNEPQKIIIERDNG
jgi:hypothetical protein